MSSPSDIDYAHGTMGKMYSCKTLKIKYWNNAAVKNNYNRALDDKLIAQIDPHGVHVVNLIMPIHTNYKGVSTVRVMGFLKCKGKDAPVTFIMDISHKHWRDFCSISDPLSASPTVAAGGAGAR